MNKHLLKIIWAQRKTNGWIFAELLLVVCAVWWMTDMFWVDICTYHSPLGFDVTNTWELKVNKLPHNASGYINEEDYHSTEMDDLYRIINQLETHPSFESVSTGIMAKPYARGGGYNGLRPVDGDTANVSDQYFKALIVSPEYFDVFKILELNNHSWSQLLENRQIEQVVLTPAVAELFFHNINVQGKQVTYGSGSTIRTNIAAVTKPIRENEFEKASPFYYEILTPSAVTEYIDKYGATIINIYVRMKQALSQDEMNSILSEMGGRLTANNIYISTAIPFSEYREEILKSPSDALNKKLAMMGFLLINVFFGIVGTFWLRTQHRQGEIGLRIALGATRYNIQKYIFVEGLYLLILTIPFTLAFALNLIYMDIPDTFRLSMTMGRFLITYGGTYLILASMIYLGIWFPAKKANKIAPAEALHYE